MKRKTTKANLFMLAVVIMSPIFSVLLGLMEWFVGVPMWLLLMAGELSILVCILLYIVFARKTVKEIFPVRKMKGKTILLCLLLSICVIPIMIVINLISQFFTTNAVTDVMRQVYELPYWVLFFILAIMPPIIEEIGFRGILLQNYRKNGVLLGVFLSAFLFGLMHGNLNQFCYAAVMGIIAALMVEATGNIFSSILLHFVVNGTNIGMLGIESLITGNSLAELYAEETTVMEQMEYTMALVASLSVFMPIAIGCCIVGFFIFRQLCHSTGRWEYIKAVFKKRIVLPDKERTVDVWLILAIVIGIIMLVSNEMLVQ